MNTERRIQEAFKRARQEREIKFYRKIKKELEKAIKASLVVLVVLVNIACGENPASYTTTKIQPSNIPLILFTLHADINTPEDTLTEVSNAVDVAYARLSICDEFLNGLDQEDKDRFDDLAQSLEVEIKQTTVFGDCGEFTNRLVLNTVNNQFCQDVDVVIADIFLQLFQSDDLLNECTFEKE